MPKKYPPELKKDVAAVARRGDLTVPEGGSRRQGLGRRTQSAYAVQARWRVRPRWREAVHRGFRVSTHWPATV